VEFARGADGNEGDSGSDFDSRAKPQKRAKKPKAAPKPKQAKAARAADEGVELTASGRRKRKDAGIRQEKGKARPWTEDEERLFLEALKLHGRDWKQVGLVVTLGWVPGVWVCV
jgi:hypothetical protein